MCDKLKRISSIVHNINYFVLQSLTIVDEIYQMDWNFLNLKTKQKLIIMMIRASRPIQLTGASLVDLSIETFLKVIYFLFIEV